MALDFPANPVNGQVFGSYIWSASKGVWQAREESAASATVSSVPPSNPTAGDIWVDSSDGVSYVYYNDGTSGQWIEMISSGVPQLSTKANLDGGNVFTGTQIFNIPLAISSGGTGSSNASSALANLGASPLIQYGEYTLPTFSVPSGSGSVFVGTPSLANGSSLISSKVTANSGNITLQPGIWGIALSFTWGTFMPTTRTFVTCTLAGTDIRSAIQTEEVQSFSWPNRRITSPQNLSFSFYQASGSSQNVTLFRTYLTWLGPAN